MVSLYYFFLYDFLENIYNKFKKDIVVFHNTVNYLEFFEWEWALDIIYKVRALEAKNT